jgi:hypothetical protein
MSGKQASSNEQKPSAHMCSVCLASKQASSKEQKPSAPMRSGCSAIFFGRLSRAALFQGLFFVVSRHRRLAGAHRHARADSNVRDSEKTSPGIRSRCLALKTRAFRVSSCNCSFLLGIG